VLLIQTRTLRQQILVPRITLPATNSLHHRMMDIWLNTHIATQAMPILLMLLARTCLLLTILLIMGQQRAQLYPLTILMHINIKHHTLIHMPNLTKILMHNLYKILMHNIIRTLTVSRVSLEIPTIWSRWRGLSPYTYTSNPYA